MFLLLVILWVLVVRIGVVFLGGIILFRVLGMGIGFGLVKLVGSIEWELVVEVKVDIDLLVKWDESEIGENGKENDFIDLIEFCVFEELGLGLR